MALQCRCQPTTTRRTSVTIRTWATMAVTAARRRNFGMRRRSRSRRHCSTKAERRAFMREYQKYLGQINALQCKGSRPFAMPVSACMDPFSNRRIALSDFNRDHHYITNDEWVAWFKSAFEEDPQDPVQKQLQLQWNKALMSDVFRYVNWLQTFAAGHQLYVGLDDESEPSPAAKPVEAPRGGKPHMPSRDSGREDAANNNGRVGGKAETIVPKNAEALPGRAA
ncbi:hypothetical protein DYB26_015447 [Aphanomyces astaci]|uniref:Uncharacterized protein n=1 Tax=Aphanomyces astaci TaxID=112090 RepID=A0A418G3B1_APHAT|nr:hypothetical protein DYB26_015447 [Aphanomyces astaci]